MKISISFIIFLFLFSFLFTEGFAQVMNLPNDFGTIVYESAGRYYVKNSHDIITGNNEPDIVIKTALARGGDIYITGGTYKLSQDFSGFDLKSGTHLKLAQDTNIVIPSGYKGYVLRFNNGASHCIVEGGNIFEADPIKRNWIGIMMQGGTKGVYFNFVENMIIHDPYIVIDFNATTTQWINANTFVNIQAYTFVKGIAFDFKGKLAGSDGINGNVFRDSQFQSGSMTTYGVEDVKHNDNAFYNVQMWDVPPNAISLSIDSSAENTVIIGGRLTQQGFIDNGVNTIVLDAWHNNPLSNSNVTSTIIKGAYPLQVSIPSTQSYQGMNMSVVPQQTTGFTKRDKDQLIISPERPTEINIYGKVRNSTGGEVILYITRPDGVIEQNQAYVTSDGTFYYPMVLDRYSVIGQYRIDGLYQNYNLGSLFLNVTSEQVFSNKTNVQSNVSIFPTSESNTTFSTSIKDSAKLWSQDKISDVIFENNIKNLIKIGVLEIPNGNQTPSGQSTHIPTWFKNNAGWWADGQISAGEFISEIQYLLNNGILQISLQ